jgi:prophage regulatory protein
MQTDRAERLLPLAAVVELTSLSRSFVYEAVKTKAFPRPVKLSPNRVAWPESVIAAWIATKIADAA